MVTYNKMRTWCMTMSAIAAIMLETTLINYQTTKKPTQPIPIQSWEKYVKQQEQINREI